jgi:hypothetical protein
MKSRLFTAWAALGLSLAILTGCGGGGGAAAPTAAAASGNAGLAGVSTQVETALSFALDGLDAGVYGLPRPSLMMSMGRVAPAGQSEPPPPFGEHTAAQCTSGSATTTFVSPTESSLIYTNCVIDSGTLNGTINIEGPTEYVENGVWTATFSDFSVTGKGVDDKNVKFNYSGSQVIKDVVWSNDNSEATAAKITMNVDINVDNGSSTIKFTNYLVNFSYNTASMETSVDMSGKFAFDLKLADFGVPATPGLPATVNVEFDVTTPTTLKFTDTTDSGVYKLTSALYTMEIDYTNDVAKFTAGGVTQTFPLAP